jgi:hypothetical protein
MRRFYVTLYTEEFVWPYKVILADDLDSAIEAARLEMPMVREFLRTKRLSLAASGLFVTSPGGTAPCMLTFAEGLPQQDIQISIRFGSAQRAGGMMPVWRR